MLATLAPWSRVSSALDLFLKVWNCRIIRPVADLASSLFGCNCSEMEEHKNVRSLFGAPGDRNTEIRKEQHLMDGRGGTATVAESKGRGWPVYQNPRHGGERKNNSDEGRDQTGTTLRQPLFSPSSTYCIEGPSESYSLASFCIVLNPKAFTLIPGSLILVSPAICEVVYVTSSLACW